jgi:hypothetical protein
VLALLAAPIGAIFGVLLLAKGTGRLRRGYGDTPGSWMVSIPLGGVGWQISSAVTRAVAAFGVARLAFALLAVRPTVFPAAAVVLMLLAWDMHRLRFLKPPLAPPASAVHLMRLQVGIGFLASSLGALLLLLR